MVVATVPTAIAGANRQGPGQPWVIAVAQASTIAPGFGAACGVATQPRNCSQPATSSAALKPQCDPAASSTGTDNAFAPWMARSAC